MKTNKTITLEQAKRRMQFFEQVEVYKPVTIFKKIIGYTLIGYGVATIVMPTGSVWAIMIGCTLMGIDYKKLMKTINFYAKETYYWFRRALK